MSPAAIREALGGKLVAHAADGRRRRAHEADAFRFERFGELCVLGEEAVAGMHRVRPERLAGLDDAGDAQVALRRGRGPQAPRLVRHAHVEGAGIGVGVHG